MASAESSGSMLYYGPMHECYVMNGANACNDLEECAKNQTA